MTSFFVRFSVGGKFLRANIVGFFFRMKSMRELFYPPCCVVLMEINVQTCMWRCKNTYLQPRKKDTVKDVYYLCITIYTGKYHHFYLAGMYVRFCEKQVELLPGKCIHRVDRHNSSVIEQESGFLFLFKVQKGNFRDLPLSLQDLLHVQILKVLGTTDFFSWLLSAKPHWKNG